MRKECENPDCHVTFHTRSYQVQKYCSKKCRFIVMRRKRMAKNLGVPIEVVSK